MPSRSVKTRRARVVDLALGITAFWAITAYTYFSSGGRSNGSLFAAFTLVAIAVWVWVIHTIRSQQAAGKSLAELQALSPDGFEDWTGARFRDLGYSVKTTGTNGDHGIDLIVEKAGLVAVVQCKNYKTWSVGEPVLRDLYGAMHDFGADRAFLVTSGRLTQAAARWVHGKPIEVWDGEQLAKLSSALATGSVLPIVENPPATPGAHDVLASAGGEETAASMEGEAVCPRCGSAMVERRNRKTGDVFLGCSSFPKCGYTRSE